MADPHALKPTQLTWSEGMLPCDVNEFVSTSIEDGASRMVALFGDWESDYLHTHLSTNWNSCLSTHQLRALLIYCGNLSRRMFVRILPLISKST